ncbi:MAG: FhaA domain-containing protein [Chloroflexota bacterium]
MPGLLGHIEALLERAVEGGSRALFRHRLQPIELAKAAARAMERQQLVGPAGIEVPNAFTVCIHAADFAEIAPYHASLETRVRRYLEEFAEERGLIPVGAVSVQIVKAEGLRRRSVRVDARMLDAVDHGGADAPPTRPVAPIAPTAHLPRVSRSQAVGDGRALVLLLEDGRQVGIGGSPLRIGRAPDNDLVIADSRVSRYHAQIAPGPGGCQIQDLGSTNGTALAGRPVTHERLADGDLVSLGGYTIRVRSTSAGRPGWER